MVNFFPLCILEEMLECCFLTTLSFQHKHQTQLWHHTRDNQNFLEQNLNILIYGCLLWVLLSSVLSFSGVSEWPILVVSLRVLCECIPHISSRASVNLFTHGKFVYTRCVVLHTVDGFTQTLLVEKYEVCLSEWSLWLVSLSVGLVKTQIFGWCTYLQCRGEQMIRYSNIFECICSGQWCIIM